MHEGECQQLSVEDVGPDLITLVQERDTYTGYQGKTTVFDSTGWALEDYVVVNLLLEHAERTGYGAEVELESIGPDPKNPYALIQRAIDETANPLRAAAGRSRSGG